MLHQHDQTSRALLEAAHRLLAEDGAAALTVRRIATEAGMSTMNVYSRFGGKDGVVDELYVSGFQRLFAVLDEVPDTDDPVADLVEFATSYRRFALEHPTYYGVMFRTTIQEYEPSQEASEFALGGLEMLAARIRAAQARGAMVADDDHDPISIAAILWASCHGMISLELGDVGVEAVDWERAFAIGVTTTLKGLRPVVVGD